MKAFTVRLTPRAKADIEEAYAWEKNVSQARADKWKALLSASIHSLRTLPARCPVAEEYSEGNRVIRRKVFGSARGVYKIYFRIVAEEVQVLHCRHGARPPIDSLPG